MKLIVFDFDGTLGNTQAVIIKSFKEATVKGGFPEPSEAECLSIIGLTLDDCFTTLLKCSMEDAKRLSAIYKEVFRSNVQDFKVQPFEGVLETLAKLKEQGYVITIATSREKLSAMELVPASGIGKYVDMIVAPQDVVNGKPAPDLTLKILETYHAIAEETWVVGDAPFDILMGKNAGCKTCAVSYGNGTLEDLKATHPDAIIDHFADLLEVI